MAVPFASRRRSRIDGGVEYAGAMLVAFALDDCGRLGRTAADLRVRFAPILLQKSQKARRLISRQRTKQAAIADQWGSKRATRIVCEFGAWRRGAPHHHSIAAPMGERI